jgi:hypothetical protein
MVSDQWSLGGPRADRFEVDSESPLTFPTCREPKDIIHLPTIKRSVPIYFALCRPTKQWIRALLPSGAYLGLAPFTTLSQTKTVSLMPQLIEKNIIDTPVWSLVLINGKDGIFSIGGTSAPSLKQAKMETDHKLAQLGTDELKKDGVISPRSPAEIEMEAAISSHEWKWSKVQGAEGWWQILMRGIWVDGIKVLDNQPIVLDVSMLRLHIHHNPTKYRLTHPSSLHLRLQRSHFTPRFPGADNYLLPTINSTLIPVSTHRRYILSS